MRVCTLCRRRRRPWRLGSPTIAGRCTNCCHCTYRRRVGHHPSNVGGPRICSNVFLSGGVETTISCGAIPVPMPLLILHFGFLYSGIPKIYRFREALWPSIGVREERRV